MQAEQGREHDNRRLIRWLPFIWFAGLAVAGLIWVIPFSAFRWDALRWGSVMTASLQICDGQVPYTEVPMLIAGETFLTHQNDYFQFDLTAMRPADTGSPPDGG